MRANLTHALSTANAYAHNLTASVGAKAAQSDLLSEILASDLVAHLEHFETLSLLGAVPLKDHAGTLPDHNQLLNVYVLPFYVPHQFVRVYGTATVMIIVKFAWYALADRP